LGPHCGSLRTAILNLKFRNRRHAAFALGSILGHKLAGRGEIVVPVPLHPRRLAERGFNQAEAIARGLVATMDARLAVDALVRTRHTKAQRSLSLAARGPNVLAAFAVTPAAESLREARVLLVDDVVTTGATIAACAQALRQAGVAEVRAVALALKV